jgi:hypothetical protein
VGSVPEQALVDCSFVTSLSCARFIVVELVLVKQLARRCKLHYVYRGILYLHDRGKSAAATIIIATAKARQPPFAAAAAHGTRAWRPSPQPLWLVLENVSCPTFATTRHCRTLVSGNIVLHGDCVPSASTVASSVKLESTPTLAATVGPLPLKTACVLLFAQRCAADRFGLVRQTTIYSRSRPKWPTG